MAGVSKTEKFFVYYFFSGPVFLVLSGFVLNLTGITRFNDSVVIYLLFFVWVGCYFYSITRFNNWPCPKCGERFFTMSFWRTSPVLQFECSNCGLPKYEGSTYYWLKIS